MTETAGANDTGNTGKRPAMSPGLKMLVEVGPLLVFFVFNFMAHRIFGNPQAENIFYATGAFMVAVVVSLAVNYSIERRLPVMPLITGFFVLIMGGLTLYLQDELFIKLKPTITNLLFAGILFTGLIFDQMFLKFVFRSAFRLSERGWRILTLRWVGFFLFMAVLNELVWRTQSTDFWVSFKLWGTLPITALFVIWQMRVVYRHPEKPHEDPTRETA